jgi:endonuclease YncB( thermonuclease family)
VEVTDTDRYGRLVGEVWIGELDLNKWLVQHGLAWWYTHYAPNRQDLADAEKQARRERIGLWADPAPMPPWDFRKAAREHNKHWWS